MWFAGLRGAIAFVLCLDVEKYSKFGGVMKTTTIVIVYFTILAKGGVAVSLLQRLNIPVNINEVEMLTFEFNS